MSRQLKCWRQVRRMTETRTLQFESPRALQSLYANDIKLLKNLEDSLGVKVTTREGWVKLEGDRRTRSKPRRDCFDQNHNVGAQATNCGAKRESTGIR